MNTPVLVVMAAGLGSRYGGLKQMDTIGNGGEWMIDYSLYDAYQAGFRNVIFIVREEILDDFKDTIGKRIEGKLNADYVVQKLTDLPEGFTLPEGRTKPWGTGHAIYSARHAIGNKSFMAINADDYYGPEAFRVIYEHLTTTSSTAKPYEFSMVGYALKNTVTDHGTVSRGVCLVDEAGYLEQITERTQIKRCPEGICYTENQVDWIPLPHESPVSLNCWGFHASILPEMEQQFRRFLEEILPENPMKAEYYLPSAVECLILTNSAKVTVCPSNDRWYGVTYQEDKNEVSQALNEMKEKGIYPPNLWKSQVAQIPEHKKQQLSI